MAVNPLLTAPRSPGPWVDDRRCAVCGALYLDHKGPGGFSDAAQQLRSEARREGDLGGGFRSRRPVLWRMRVTKLADWFLEHAVCGSGWCEQTDMPLPLPTVTDELARLPEVLPIASAGSFTIAVRGWWDDDDLGAPLQAASQLALAHWCGIEATQVEVTHGHARWGFGGRTHGGNRVLRLVPADSSTRGAFRATVIQVLAFTALDRRSAA